MVYVAALQNEHMLAGIQLVTIEWSIHTPRIAADTSVSCNIHSFFEYRAETRVTCAFQALVTHALL